MLDTIVKNSKGVVIGGVLNRLKTDKNVEFLNLQGSNLEVGFMKRDDKSNVKPHRHNYIARKIEGTHEIILFLSGEAEILFYEPDGELIKSIIVNAPCLVFFNGGCHAIKFHKECELVEIKQGPYLATEDKVILNLRDNNDSRI